MFEYPTKAPYRLIIADDKLEEVINDIIDFIPVYEKRNSNLNLRSSTEKEISLLKDFLRDYKVYNL
jgi:hypothetical protein